jgi:plasmid stability protein
MPGIQIDNVPDDVHRELQRRAGAAGQSLQEYVLDRLVAEAREPPLDEVLARAASRSGGKVDFRFAVDALRSDRQARE